MLDDVIRDPGRAYMATFGERIRDFRKSRDFTLDGLARATGISKTYLWQLEKDLNVPSAAVLQRLADIFGVTMDDLWRHAIPRRQSSIVEALESLRDAGGDGWDRIDDPRKYLDEMDD